MTLKDIACTAQKEQRPRVTRDPRESWQPKVQRKVTPLKVLFNLFCVRGASLQQSTSTNRVPFSPVEMNVNSGGAIEAT